LFFTLIKTFGCLVLLQRGFVEANVDDGLLEIFGLKHGWHASFVLVELISAKHIAQVRSTNSSFFIYYYYDLPTRIHQNQSQPVSILKYWE